MTNLKPNRLARDTGKTTAAGETIYDLDPQSAELWAVAGPAGLDPTQIDPDALPDGVRWISDAEWGEAGRCSKCDDTDCRLTRYRGRLVCPRCGPDSRPFPGGTIILGGK